MCKIKVSDNKFVRCRNNLVMLRLALWNYYDDYGTFPPPYTLDDDGNPVHSWRVLVLPYIELLDRKVYNYDYNSSWNSPQNQHLCDKMPNVFRCPYSPEKNKNTPSYELITSSANNIKGMSNFFLLVEIKDTDFNWLEPVVFSSPPAWQNENYSVTASSSITPSVGYYHNKQPRTSIITRDGTIFEMYLLTPIKSKPHHLKK